MLVIITIVILLGVVGMFLWMIRDFKKQDQIAYKDGYRDAILDIDEMLNEWSERGIESAGIMTIRNRIFEFID